MLKLSDDLLDRLLTEDVPYGDLTTHSLGIGPKPGKMRFSARGPMVVCCVEEAVRLVEKAGGLARAHCKSGDWREPGALLLEAEGPAEALMMAWKAAQVLMEATSGIATATRRIVEAAWAGGGATVSCTRKTFPGGRAQSVKAILAGGGTPHRLGLSDTILLFAEHRAFLGDDLGAAVARLKAACPEKKLVAEAQSPEDAVELARAGVDILQADKFTPQALHELARHLSWVDKPPVLAAAGGIDASNAEAFVRAGAQILVTSSPYWARPCDVQVNILPV